MKPLAQGLPLESRLSEIRGLLTNRNRLVLTAEPGSGKTTVVPLALFEEPWAANRKILVLEPRRIAAAAAATRMAELMGEPVGQTVGYRVALENRVGPRTQVEVVTEGILIRMLQSDPALTGVSAVILDEFHERTLAGDLSLALTLQAQETLREDLRLIVMSATLAEDRLLELLAPAEALKVPGRTFPVETQYFPLPERSNLWDWTAEQVADVLRTSAGDVLVFLPGQGEIRRVRNALGMLPATVDLRELYGSLPLAEQKQVLTPTQTGRRKVVLATNVAETSLTLPGVRVVIDTGCQRLNTYDPASGMDRLLLRDISQASADQRRGRAGRTQGGECRRLWARAQVREAYTSPEIERADLTALVLECALWGTPQPHQLRWPTPPALGPWKQALGLLRNLGALDAQDRVTHSGRKMAELGMAPRLAAMVLRSQGSGREEGALACAALLSERPPDRGGAVVDFRQRLEVLRSWDRGQEMIKRWRQQLGFREKPLTSEVVDHLGEILVWAFPDRIAGRQDREEEGLRDGIPQVLFQTTGGRAVWVSGPLSREDFLVIPEADAGMGTGKAYGAAPLSRDFLEKNFSDRWEGRSRFSWRGWKYARQTGLFWGALCLSRQQPSGGVGDSAEIQAAVAERLAAEGLEELPWTSESREWVLRCGYLGHGWSTAELLDTAPEWLFPFLQTTGEVLTSALLSQALRNRLPWKEQKRLEEDVPTHLTVPSGSRRPLRYEEGKPPVLEVRIQEVFGLAETPKVAGQPVLLHLLSPSQRPLQVTQDLASFWKNTYPEVRKEMRGRYPRHYWPENPLEAEPTARAKPRGK